MLHLVDRWPAGPLVAVVAVVLLPGDQEVVPAEEVVGADQGRDGGQQLALQRLARGRQLAALVVVEADVAAPELLPEDGVLGTEIVDDALLLAVGVAMTGSSAVSGA
jgi:hypothetical protein